MFVFLPRLFWPARLAVALEAKAEKNAADYPGEDEEGNLEPAGHARHT